MRLELTYGSFGRPGDRNPIDPGRPVLNVEARRDARQKATRLAAVQSEHILCCPRVVCPAEAP